jgi:hypothetical protein
MLTLGTALRHAQEGGTRVHALVGGMWMSGTVVALDGEGVVLLTPEGETVVVRLRAVTAVRVEQDLGRPERAPESADARTAREAGAPQGWSATGEGIARDLAAVARHLELV